MKYFRILSFILNLFAIQCNAQNISKFLLYNNELYFGYNDIANNYYTKIKKYKLETESPPYITLLSGNAYSSEYRFPISCDIYKDSLVILISFHKSDYNLWSFDFDENKLYDIDSVQQRIKQTEFLKKYPTITEQIKYYESIEGTTQRNVGNYVSPISSLFHKHKEAQLDRNKLHGVVRLKFLREPLEMRDITYDFFWQKDNEFMFFVRDDAMFTQWHYNYPGKTVLNKPEDWSETRTYTWQPKGSYEKQDTMPYLPSGKKHIYNAFADTLANFMLIDSSFAKLKNLPDTTLTKLRRLQSIPFVNDSIYHQMLTDSVGKEEVKQYYTQIKQAGQNLFFKGHFNGIRQGTETFIVNLQYGGIYWLGAKEVVRVGQFDVNSYPKKLFGKQIFIDDRDNERLIFFAPIKRLNNNKPFPVIFVPTEKEFQEMFKYVINKCN